MVDYLSRDDWGARKPTPGPGLLDPDWVEGVAVHWPGTESDHPIHTVGAVASALRGWQAYHMDDRGWSDIAYQVAVDQAGRAWTLRGLRNQSGANGDTEANKRYGAILLVLIAGEEPSEAMKGTVRAVVGDFRRLFPHGTMIRPHWAVRPEPTDCPGPAATAALERGEFTPGHQTTPSHPEDDMWTPEQAGEVQQRYVLADQLWRAQTAAEQAASNALAVQLLAKGTPIETVVAEVEKIWRPVQRDLAARIEALG